MDLPINVCNKFEVCKSHTSDFHDLGAFLILISLLLRKVHLLLEGEMLDY